MRLQGKVALVTGASRGIGASIAERFAAEGAMVGVNYHTNRAKADALVERIASSGGVARAVQADLRNPAAIGMLIAQTVETDLYVAVGLDKRIDAILAATPLGRIGQPDDVAGAALLASDDAAWITGEILQVSGGRSL